MANLTDLGKKVRNTVNRNSQCFLLTEALDKNGTSYTIDAVDTSNNSFDIYDQDVSGDSEFNVGEEIYVDGSTGNDSNYTVASVSTGDFDGEADSTDSRVFVEESIEDGTADGTIYVAKDFVWVNMGRFTSADFTSESVASEADQDGRESAQLFDVTASWSLMQTSNEELSLMGQFALPSPGDYGFYKNGHTIYFSGSNQVRTSDINAATDNATGEITFGTGNNELDDPDGIEFVNVLLKPSPEINLSGEDAMIALEFTGTVFTDELDDIETSHKIVISPE
jgi:hypothetical protein